MAADNSVEQWIADNRDLVIQQTTTTIEQLKEDIKAVKSLEAKLLLENRVKQMENFTAETANPAGGRKQRHEEVTCPNCGRSRCRKHFLKIAEKH